MKRATLRVCMNQILDNLFEVINEFLECSDVVALFATSKSVRMLLVLPDNVVRRSRRTSLSFVRVSDWELCSTWMSVYRFVIGCLIFDNSEQVVTYFKSVLHVCASPSLPSLSMPVRILYQGGSVPAPLIVIPDDLMLRKERIFSNCAEDCFASLYESNVLYNSRGIVETDTDRPISLDDICIAVVSSNDDLHLSNNRDLHSVYFCVGVQTIDNRRLENCTSLISVVLPEGLISIGDYTFEGCSSLSSVVLPEGITSVGGCAFSDCSSLSLVVLPEGLISIGDYAFHGCSSLSSVVLPDGLTSIGDNAFCNCLSLSSVILPEGLTKIGDYAFHNCSSLSSVVLPDGLTSIGDYAFYGCSSLSSVVLPDGLTNIGDDAFPSWVQIHNNP